MSNWIQDLYQLDSTLSLPCSETEKTDQVEQTTIVGYTYNKRGRVDGVVVQSENGQTKEIDWLELSRLRMERLEV